MRDWRKYSCAGGCGVVQNGDAMHAFESGVGASKTTVHYCRECCPRCAKVAADAT